MSAKAVTQPYQVVTNGDMSGTVTSLVTTVNTQDNAGYQVKYSGTPTGSFFVDASINGVDWEALAFSPAPVAVGAAGSFLINMNQLPYHLIRLRYVPTSGSGTLQAWTMAKRLGG